MEEYSDNLKLAAVTMLTGASDAESSANLIKQVWYNAIYEKEMIRQISIRDQRDISYLTSMMR